jgi:hypothetical protein
MGTASIQRTAHRAAATTTTTTTVAATTTTRPGPPSTTLTHCPCMLQQRPLFSRSLPTFSTCHSRLPPPPIQRCPLGILSQLPLFFLISHICFLSRLHCRLLSWVVFFFSSECIYPSLSQVTFISCAPLARCPSTATRPASSMGSKIRVSTRLSSSAHLRTAHACGESVSTR